MDLTALTGAGTLLSFIETRLDLTYSSGQTLTKFHEDRSKYRLRVVRGPNRCSKSFGGAWEANWHSLHHPGSVGGVLVADLVNHFGTLCETIHKTIARSELSEETKYVPGKGYFTNGRRGITYKNGSRWEFRSGKSELMALAATTWDWLWVDEIPFENHMTEALRAVSTSGGPVWVTFTPIGRPVEYFRTMIEGDKETGELPTAHWEQYVPSLTVEDCPWRTAEDIEAQVALIPWYERPQRAHGAWEGPSGHRLFDGYHDAPPPDGVIIHRPPKGSWLVTVCIDHGERAGHEYAALLFHNDTKIIAVDEYKSVRATTIEDDANGILAMLHRQSLGPLSVDRWVGDTNSAGKSGVEGLTINMQISDAIGHGVRIQKPRKGKGSVGLGERMIGYALTRRDLLVCRGCKTLRTSLAHYTGADDDTKHAVDALRYGSTPILAGWAGDYSRLIIGY